MKEAREAEKMRDISTNAREMAKRELEKHLNLFGDEPEESVVRMQHIDHHMYLDDSSAGPPDPAEHPDKIVYAPVRMPAAEEPIKDQHEEDREIEHLKIAVPKRRQSMKGSKRKMSKQSSVKFRSSPRSSAAGSTAIATGDEQDAHSDILSFEMLTPFTAQGEFHISNTWSLNPLSEMSYDEKMILKAASRREVRKF